MEVACSGDDGVDTLFVGIKTEASVVQICQQV